MRRTGEDASDLLSFAQRRPSEMRPRLGRVRPLAALHMKLVVSLDVEADNQWDHGVPLATRNVASWEPFQELCEGHGVVPTYLLASEIIADDRARELLAGWRARGVAEIGAHLHPWTTPPFADAPGLRMNDYLHAFPCELPDDLLREKVSTLTGQIRDAFGFSPTAFRAGRYGFDGRVAKCIADEGFVVDSSVTPGIAWHDFPGMSGGGPDFSRLSIKPFRIAGTGDPGLVEIPVTVLQTYPVFARFPGLLRAYGWLPVRAVRRVVFRRYLKAQPMWLAPWPSYRAEDLALVWRRAAEAGVEVAVMSFHSSELMAGGSPFRPTLTSIRDLYACLDKFFAYVRQCDGECVGLTEAARVVAGRPDLEVRPL